MSEITLRTFSSDRLLITERRNHIVRGAIKVFVKKGFDQTNMREVAKACAMSPGNLYHYFGSKTEILYLIIHDATSEQAEYLENLAASFGETEPSVALTKLIRCFLEWHDRSQDVTLFVYQETRSLPENARKQIFESEGRIQSVFEQLLKRGMDSGAFNVNDPGLIAHNIIVSGHTWALRRWFLRKRWSFEEYVAKQTELILTTLHQGKEKFARERDVGEHKENRGSEELHSAISQGTQR